MADWGHDLRDARLLTAASRSDGTVTTLGEGPIWDDRARCVYFVDIVGHQVFRLDGADLSARTVIHTSDREVTCVLPATDGGLLFVERDRIVTRSPDGILQQGPSMLDDPQRRFNDGICDPQGRLLIGTLHEGGADGEEFLLRIASSGSVDVIVSGLTLSNGLGFDPSGKRMYHVDTLRHLVNVYDYTAAMPMLVHSFTVAPGYPDGLTVDAEGFVWVAVWGGSEVRRYSPDGILDARLPVPARNVTAPAFVGDALDELIVTTATDGLDLPTNADGGLYRANVGVRGVVPYRWAGSTSGKPE
jgi:sugar lactone lactonase YvrE